MKLRELITFSLICVCYGLWAIILWSTLPLWASVPILGGVIALQSSLQHEALHGHPTRWQWINDALVFPSLNLFIPYLRFKDTHLAHHKNERLTDPYDDPESNYLPPVRWHVLCRYRQAAMRANNTLLGRMALGPLIGQIYFMMGDWRLICAGDRRVLAAWVGNSVVCGAILAMVLIAGFPIWAYLIAAYLGLSLLKIRTFAEHQAHEKVGPRTVVIEDRGPLAFLFLNNNYHIVHHMHPGVAWYELPALYRARKDRFLRRNQGYAFPNYRAVFSRYWMRAKDPVVHPHWQDK